MDSCLVDDLRDNVLKGSTLSRNIALLNKKKPVGISAEYIQLDI